jgi:outer membrane protein TolC
MRRIMQAEARVMQAEASIAQAEARVLLQWNELRAILAKPPAERHKVY